MSKHIKPIKQIIDDYFMYTSCGIFDCEGWAPDNKIDVYNVDGVKVNICLYYMYIEVIGLAPEEFKEIENYYHRVREDNDAAD